MSNLTTLARPYAKAAFELADGQDDLAGWDLLLNTAGDVVADESVSLVLGNPQVSRPQATSLVSDALGEAAPEAFRGFLRVLGENDRLSLLPEIARLFGNLRQAAERRLAVRVVSAVALDEEQSGRMQRALAKRFDCEIEMHNEVDSAVLGGAVIYAGNQVIDGSLRGRLEKLQAGLA